VAKFFPVAEQATDAVGGTEPERPEPAAWPAEGGVVEDDGSPNGLPSDFAKVPSLNARRSGCSPEI
jgi:hypothetical protein